MHPAQVDTVNRLFMRGEKEISFAQRVMQEAQREENRRLGAFSLDGKMVDAPVIARAEGVLARAERYGLIDNQNERYGDMRNGFEKKGRRTPAEDV